MQVMTQLFPEKYPVQKVRPYNGEQVRIEALHAKNEGMRKIWLSSLFKVPRDVWMTLGGYIFAHPNERIAVSIYLL